MDRVSASDIMSVLSELNTRNDFISPSGDYARYRMLYELAESDQADWIHELVYQAHNLDYITFAEAELLELLLNHPEQFRTWMKTLNL